LAWKLHKKSEAALAAERHKQFPRQRQCQR